MTKIQNPKQQQSADKHLMLSWRSLIRDGLFLSFEHLDFGFVSDFEIRVSDFSLSRRNL